jgi:hypothetical protein
MGPRPWLVIRFHNVETPAMGVMAVDLLTTMAPEFNIAHYCGVIQQ